MDETHYCTHKDEVGLRDFVPHLSDERHVDALKEILMDHKVLNRILCH
jgi:hypothetical protein